MILSTGREFIFTRRVIGRSELRAFGMAIISIGTCVPQAGCQPYGHLFQVKSAQDQLPVLFRAFIFNFLFFSTAEHSVSRDELSGSSAVKLLYFLY